jgi:uncharacterized membrane protein YphA (DoxX/SURF4 family)
MRGIWGINPAWGITAVRLAVAIILIVAGYQKFAGGIPGVQAFMGKVGIPLPGLIADTSRFSSSSVGFCS